MSSYRKYGTCFFEQYAKISLESILGEEFSCLVNRDRPDLQSPDDKSMGIEVTRAMEENKMAANALLKEISGIVPEEKEEEMEAVIENGYGFGLGEGNFIGAKEFEYWSMALPLRRILKSKISKAGNGFYGRFDKMGLYIFCKDQLRDSDAVKTCRYAMALQESQDIKYDRLYLSETGNLYVCNLMEGLAVEERIQSHPISRSQRKEFYLEAIHERLGES